MYMYLNGAPSLYQSKICMKLSKARGKVAQTSGPLQVWGYDNIYASDVNHFVRDMF